MWGREYRGPSSAVSAERGAIYLSEVTSGCRLGCSISDRSVCQEHISGVCNARRVVSACKKRMSGAYVMNDEHVRSVSDAYVRMSYVRSMS